MAPNATAARRAFSAAALAAGALLASTPSSATPPSLTPKVLQCDGSFATGPNTSHPTPTVRVELQSTNPGLKIGQRRLSVLPSSTLALWRFDGSYDVVVSSNYTVGCSTGCCKTWYFSYTSANGSPDLTTGRCSYADTVNADCSVLSAMTSTGTPHHPVEVAGGCPTSDPTSLPSGNFTITETGPRTGPASEGLSAKALKLLDSTSQYATAANSTAWDLPASYTLSAWVNAPGPDAEMIVSQQNSGNFWGIGLNSAGKLRHRDSRDATNDTDVAMGGSLFGAWHLVHVVRRNGVDRRFYVDGVIVGSTVAASTTTFASHPIGSDLVIGRNLLGGSNFFNGSIDDIRILNNVIGDDDIMLEWDTQMHKYSSNSGVSFSTVAGSYSGSPANGTTAVVTYIPPEPYSATARWVFAAQNIDGEKAFSSSYGVNLDNSPPIAPSLTGTANSQNDVTWSWDLPPRVCLPPGSASVNYQLVNAASGATMTPPGDMAHPASTVGESLAGEPNQIVGRRLRVTDTWGSGLSAPTSVYTLANPPLSVTPSVVSTGSALISWDQNGNPAYTRYLLSLSQDPSFATGVSTPATLASNYTGSTLALAGLSMGTTYSVRVQAFNGRSGSLLGGTSTVFDMASFTTLPGAPSLGGSPLSNASIQWTWTQVPGALSYTLLDGAGATLYAGGERFFIQAGLAANTQYAASVEAVSAGGTGARSTAAAFTLANDPTAPAVSAVHMSSISYSWNGNLNPAYTYYEVAVTTDATFGFIVTTVTVSGTAAAATGLFPDTVYYARLRSINGEQRLGNYVAIASARTLSDPAVTVVAAPPSAYVPPNGSVGQWHFDESTGAIASDSSGLGNTALLTCLAAACVSTPTFTSGRAGLGSAISFSGLADSLVRVPDSASYAFTDDLTISAWVMPSSLSQPSGAGLVVRGSDTVNFNFALDLSGGLYRFTPASGFVAASTNPFAVGTWTHLIGVYDSASSSATLYVNGRPASSVPFVPARAASDHDISIGNRQSASAAYDRGFQGVIDDVRIQHRALNAAEALAQYQGNFVTTVTPPAPNDNILIGLAPNAFGAPATLFVSIDPVTHPITITPAALNAGLTVIPTGHALVPNSIIEVVPIVAGAAFTQTLGSSASISMPYRDADGDNILDNTNPPLAASSIEVYTLNTTVNRWESLPALIDPASRRVTAFTPHFSVFAMFAPLTVGTSLSQLRAYPVPWRPGSRGRFDAAGVTFDRLPTSGTILILNLAGERVREFAFNGAAAGAIDWNGLTDGGHRAASGVYFARVTAFDGSSTLVKFAIER